MLGVFDLSRAYAALVELSDDDNAHCLAAKRLRAALDGGDDIELTAATISAELELKDFDPNQLRDSQGRWARILGGGQRWEPTGSEAQILGTWTGAQSHVIAHGYQNGKPKTEMARRFDRALMAIPPLPRQTVHRAMNIDLKASDLPGFEPLDVWMKRFEGLTDEEAQRRWDKENPWPQFSEPWDKVKKPEDVVAYYQAKIGETITIEHPESATTARENVQRLGRGPNVRVVYDIDTDRARPIGDYAAHREAWEAEAIVPPGRFKIIGAEVQAFPITDPQDPRRGQEDERIAVVRLRDVTA
jgi:hypothetical protein